MKVCQECLKAKPSSAFWKQSRNKDGLFRMCKECARNYEKTVRDPAKTKTRKAEHYQQNREKTLRDKKKYYKDNKAKLLEYKKKYYKKNFSDISKKQLKYRQDNEESLKNYMKEYRAREEFTVQRRHYSHSRRAKIKSSCDGTITKEFLITLLNKQKHSCYYCGTLLYKGNTHLDHYIPISKGGIHSVGNVVFSCQKCNLQKSATMPTNPLTFPIS